MIGAMCTYHRADDLRGSLDALERQTQLLDRLIIVDNGSDPATADIVSRHPLARRIRIDLVDPERNLGPAGGYASAFECIDGFAADDDLMVILDDDDPPPSDTVVEELAGLADRVLTDPAIAGVGLRGGQLDLRTGLIASRPRTTTQSTEAADHLHGGWMPTYRIGALRAADAFDAQFFWGFDDLELGRRLDRAGYGLRVAADTFRRLSPPRVTRREVRLAPRSWRHYYRHRNLLRVLQRDRAFGAIAITVIVRLIAKPLANIALSPGLALWHLRTNVEAIRDGLIDRRRADHPRHLPPEPEDVVR